MKSNYPWSIALIVIIFFTSCSKKTTISYFENGVKKLEAEDFEGAILDFTKVLEEKSDSVKSLALRAYCYYQIDSFKKGIDDYDYYIKFEPNFSDSYYYRGLCKYSINDKEGSINDFDIAIKLSSANLKFNSLSAEFQSELVKCYFARGCCLRHFGHIEKAILDLDKVIELQPEYQNAYNERGRCYGILGNHEKAISDCSKAIEIDPMFGDPHAIIGISYFLLDNYNEALKSFDRAIELDANNDKAFFYRGMCKFLLGISGACEDMKKAYQLGDEKAMEMMEEICPDVDKGIDKTA